MAKVKDGENVKELLRRAKAAGIPVDNRVQTAGTRKVIVTQDSESYYSELFDFNGGAGMILPVKIVSKLSAFSVSDLSIQFDRWRGGWFRPIEPVADPTWPRYEFVGRSELKFNREEVINHLLSEGRVLRAGYPMRGLLLAFSVYGMPDDLRRGEILDGVIQIFDQFGDKHSGKLRVLVERQGATAIDYLRALGKK